MKRVRVVVHGTCRASASVGPFEASAVAAGRRLRAEPLRRNARGAVEGDGDADDQLIAFCESGPRGADVARVEAHEEEPEGLRGFEVRQGARVTRL